MTLYIPRFYTVGMKESKRQEKTEGKSPVWQKSRHANLVRYVPSGTFYARYRIGGKLTWKSLETTAESIAKSKLDALLRHERKVAAGPRRLAEGKCLISDCVKAYREAGFRPAIQKKRKDGMTLKPAAVAYYEQRLTALEKGWPELTRLEAKKVTDQEVKKWADRARLEMSGSAFNHTLGFLKNLFDYAIKAGARFDNPASGIMRESETAAEVKVLNNDQFHALVTEIENAGGGFSRACADLVRFLAFGGFRKTEAAYVTWGDVDFIRGQITVRGHPETGLKNRAAGEIKTVPMIPELRELLTRLRAERPEEPPTDYVMKVRECQKAVHRASVKLGIPELTHHGFRHLFATKCIESGVDIPTVARWMGHKDGGALLMKTYTHLLDDHAKRMATKVSFGKKPEDNILPMPKEASAS